MNWKILSIIGSFALIAGCASVGEDDGMIPPSANYSPIQAPVYPPLNQPYSPNLLNDDGTSRVLNIDRLNVGEANIPSNIPQVAQTTPQQTPQMPHFPQNAYPNNYETPYPPQYSGDYSNDFVPGYIAPNSVMPEIVPYDEQEKQTQEKQMEVTPKAKEPNIIPNSPIIATESIIELSAVGMGVAPESTISPSQALALAKRAAIIDAYRQIGEKMYGIKINAQDTLKDMVLSNSVVKARVEALIKNADIVETIYKDGLCQVTMELKLDGRAWSKVLATN